MSHDRETPTPPPGHAAARLQGCVCPRYDNNHGAGTGITDLDGRPVYAMVLGCPVHWPDVHDDAIPEFQTRLL